jgi:glycosyltransferase involved in cell wall biosynthesis
LITVSAAARDEVAREMRVSPNRVAVVPNGVDASSFRPLPQLARVPGRLIATLSADVPLKGMVPLLEAVACVRRQRPAELIVVGKPRDRGPIPRLVSRLGLERAVRFANGIDESRLVELYAQAEVAVVPSLYEGFSLPAVEAMACAVPVVATTAGALPEVVGRDGDAGLLVPPGDPAALATAIERALADGGLRRRMGERGRARVLERFTWERAAERTVDQYHELLAC